jgi:hypothetical protein
MLVDGAVEAARAARAAAVVVQRFDGCCLDICCAVRTKEERRGWSSEMSEKE